MARRTHRALLSYCAAAFFALGVTAVAGAEPVPVRHPEGVMHGFLVLRTQSGQPIADGEMIQNAHGTNVTSELVFHFKDGSLYDDTTVFSQAQQLRLISDHLVEKGPSFPQAMDVTVDAPKGQVTVHYDDHGRPKTTSQHLDLPADVANGLIEILLKNVDPAAPPKSFSYVAASPDPRLVKVLVSESGNEPFVTGSTLRKAVHYILKIDIGGIKGLLAPLFGKQPADAHVWILPGAAPAFMKSELQLYNQGPVWQIEPVSPTPRNTQ